MDKISGELKQAELKKETLYKAYEKVQSQASTVLSFTLLWKDVEEHFDGVRKSLERRSEVLDEGERSLAERTRDMVSQEDGLRSARQRVEKEVRRKKMDLRSVEKQIQKSRVEQRKNASRLFVMRDALRECTLLIRDKKEELSSLRQLFKECRRDYDSMKEEVEVVRRKLESKKKKIGVVESVLGESSREFDRKAEALASVKHSINSLKWTREEQWQRKTEEPEKFAVYNADDSPPPPPILARDDLQLFQTELSNENAMTCQDISQTLQNSPDPAKLVLDVIAGYNTQHSNNRDMNLETAVLRSQIVLLGQLVRISPSITHDVKERAMKLAREWKAKLSDKPKSHLEVSAFQHFLVVYNLLSLFNDAPPLGKPLGLVNEITAPASTPASLPRVPQQPPRDKKRSAHDKAIDVQSQPCAWKCKYTINNQGGPL